MLINGLKFSCATCIKGHRASNCKHTDRPLFEIRKKGRPVSQCLLCRDLRKTKQLHIKCICNKNKKDTISKKATDPCECQAQQKNELPNPSSSSSSTVKRLSPIIIPSQTMSSSSSTSSNSSSGSSPPYCWALVRPEENHQCQIHSQQNMGYVFQKSGQERRRRMSKSLKGTSSPSSASVSSSSVLTINSTQSSLAPSFSKSRPKKPPSSQPLTTPATSTLLDNYLATTNAASLPLSRSLSSSSATLDHDMMKELDDDLCSLLDNMIYQQQQQQQQHLHHHQDDLSSQLSSTSLLPSSTSMNAHSPSSSPSSSVPLHSIGSASNSSSSGRSAYQGEIHSFYGQCQKLAQWHPQGPPPGQIGESVIITMTPLPKWNSPPHQNDLQTSPQQQQTTISTTKIVTCYCGPSCNCPGCLVHPTSSIFASQGLDPYAGYPIQNSVSSDED